MLPALIPEPAHPAEKPKAVPMDTTGKTLPAQSLKSVRYAAIQADVQPVTISTTASVLIAAKQTPTISAKPWYGFPTAGQNIIRIHPAAI